MHIGQRWSPKREGRVSKELTMHCGQAEGPAFIAPLNSVKHRDPQRAESVLSTSAAFSILCVVSCDDRNRFNAE